MMQALEDALRKLKALEAEAARTPSVRVERTRKDLLFDALRILGIEDPEEYCRQKGWDTSKLASMKAE